MKDSVLVTLADERFLEQAKQLFSSAYWKGGWRGDYVLLAYDIPEEKLTWFESRGILVKRVPDPPIHVEEKYWSSTYPPSVLAKFYVFTTEFKQWKHVVFLDSDIIVRANMNMLTTIKGFGAVTDMLPFIESQIDDYAQTTIHATITNAKAFNSGVFSFSTDIIAQDTFQKICVLAAEYVGRTMYFPDQAILNVFFYKQWIRIPFYFNLYYITLPQKYKDNPSRTRCVILHFAGEYKPWDAQSPYHEEWEENLRMADAMDLKHTKAGVPYSSSIFDALYYRYFYTIEFVYLYSKFINKTTKFFGLLFGYFKKDIIMGRGWYVPEYHDIKKRFFIWNSRQSEIFITSKKITGGEFDIMFSPFNKGRVIIETYNKNSLIARREYTAQSEIMHFEIDAGTTRIKFLNDVFIPTYQESSTRDIRKLGIMLLSPVIIYKKGKTIFLPLDRVISYKYAEPKE